MRIRGSIKDAFVHFAALGLAAIVETELKTVAKIRWSSQEAVEVVTSGNHSDTEIAAAVHRHASAHALPGSWTQKTAPLNGKLRSPFSPRVGLFSGEQQWKEWHQAKENMIDEIPNGDFLDLRFIGALGEPSYWCEDPSKSSQVNSGASQWEMKTRNKGKEFFQDRLAILPGHVSARRIEAVAAGLVGDTVLDEAGKNATNSRTPTGLRAPGPTDNARAWCALWGISNFPVRPVVVSKGHAVSVTASATRIIKGPVRFYLPVIEDPITLARYRVIVRGVALLKLVWRTESLAPHAPQAEDSQLPSNSDLKAAAAWSEAHGVVGFMMFKRYVSDNSNSPEFWAQLGEYSPVRGT